MKCPNCGRDVPDHVHFCPGCGYPLQEKAIEQENKSNEGRYAVQQHSGNNRHLMPILISVLVAVVLIVLIICVTMLKKGDQNLAAQTAQQTQSSSMRSSAESSAVSSAVSSAAPTSSSQAPSSAVSSKPQVVNNYYYYASGAGLGKGNVQDYYNNVSDSGYLWPTDTACISVEQLQYFDKDQVNAILNEIYARHGYNFQTAHWSNYFNNKTWYVRDPSCNESNVRSRLNSIELANVDTIVKYQQSHGWR
ncbi:MULTISPECIES: YARHG domain-containing protein [Caproicibacterium]|jgi:hypothetical protein|uniref:YARHG domain-containing protein n=1 Tax=Caproicibacterium lactatifermentans TaxID=2666138 RepID=A0A859DRM6_9FIRM|nr:YARHG domain-containing protein [Caproicibacterium lactatifermentans]ARP51320.1 hypothetical protein B6259_08095 [Ruminococcaceae bacterium CPB6]MDD4807729.1 YARHG domain-containing protein [Oscillospiraceae bacterium]QKN23442.1 YARHG domain-containing protein [Caproicibacterium lactatifermentans]QKO31152.1 YARHG domain-containing protein [Caproicibacterium lactatifermentans]